MRMTTSQRVALLLCAALIGFHSQGCGTAMKQVPVSTETIPSSDTASEETTLCAEPSLSATLSSETSLSESDTAETKLFSTTVQTSAALSVQNTPTDSAPVSASVWAKAYLNLLEQLPPSAGNLTGQLFYLDNNDVPELFLSTDAEYYLGDIYTYTNGACKKIFIASAEMRRDWAGNRCLSVPPKHRRSRAL